jgi:hypothetical protein
MEQSIRDMIRVAANTSPLYRQIEMDSGARDVLHGQHGREVLVDPNRIVVGTLRRAAALMDD